MRILKAVFLIMIFMAFFGAFLGRGSPKQEQSWKPQPVQQPVAQPAPKEKIPDPAGLRFGKAHNAASGTSEHYMLCSVPLGEADRESMLKICGQYAKRRIGKEDNFFQVSWWDSKEVKITGTAPNPSDRQHLQAVYLLARTGPNSFTEELEIYR